MSRQGKTLQAICLIWTLLNNSMDGQEPLVRRVVISCPTSLVGMLVFSRRLHL